MPMDEPILIHRMVELATRYGYRRITAMLQQEGWQVNHKRTERLWRRKGLESPPPAAEAETIVVPRRVLPAAPPPVCQACLEL